MSENNISKEDMLKAIDILIKGSTEHFKVYLDADQKNIPKKKNDSDAYLDVLRKLATDKQVSKDSFDDLETKVKASEHTKDKKKSIETSDIILDLYTGIKENNPQYVDNDVVKEMLDDIRSHFENAISNEGASLHGKINRLPDGTASIKLKLGGNITDFKNLMMYALYLYGMHPDTGIGYKNGALLDSNDDITVLSEMISLISLATIKEE